MAIENLNQNEGQTEGQEIETPDLEVENGEESPTGGSPTPDYESRFASLEDQLRRANEDRETLRETLRLNQRMVEESRPKTQKQLTDEQKALRELGLVFGDDVKESMQPLVGTVSNLYDSNDAVMFQLYLGRENPEALNGESFDKVSQIVESIRQQQARNGGGYLRRQDAYLYAKGAGLLEKVVAKKQAKQQANVDEMKRQNAVKNANASSGNSVKTGKAGVTAEVQKIREKAHQGIRLTPEERAKWKEAIGDQTF